MRRFEFLLITSSTTFSKDDTTWSKWKMTAVPETLDCSGTRDDVLQRASLEGWELRSTDRDARVFSEDVWFYFQRPID